MRRSRWTRLFAVLAAVSLIGAACGDDDDEEAEKAETTDEAGDDAAPEEEFDGVTLTATEYEFDAPDEMHASTVNVQAVNEGAVAHEFVFVKLGDQTREEFFEELDALFESQFQGPLPSALQNGIVGPGTGTIQPGDDPIVAEMSLTEGNWILFCALTDEDTEGADEGGGGGGDEPSGQADEEEEGEEEEGEGPQLPPHYQSGMFKEITVTGDAEPTAPEGSTITAIDYGFEGLDDLEAETEWVALNSPKSKQVHHIAVSDFGTDITAQDAEAAFEEQLAAFAEEGGGGGGGDEPKGQADEEEGGEGEGAPGPEPEDVGETLPLAPGYGTTVDLKLESGHTYLFACFLPDATGGQPHAAANKMYKAVTLA